MAEILKNKVKDVNAEPFSAYFNVPNLANYEKVIITNDLSNLKGKEMVLLTNNKELKKDLKRNSFNIINIVSNETTEFIGLSKIKTTDYLYLDMIDNRFIDAIKSYSGIIIASNPELLISLGLIKEDNYENNIVIDRYGIITKF